MQGMSSETRNKIVLGEIESAKAWSPIGGIERIAKREAFEDLQMGEEIGESDEVRYNLDGALRLE